MFGKQVLATAAWDRLDRCSVDFPLNYDGHFREFVINCFP